jgi:hypothetical protein
LNSSSNTRLYPCPAIGAGVLGSDDDVVVVVVVPVDVDTDVEVLVLAVVVAGAVVVEPVDVDVEPVAGTTVLVDVLDETVGGGGVETIGGVEAGGGGVDTVGSDGTLARAGGDTTPDGPEAAKAEPFLFVAVTTTRSVEPTSLELSRNVVPSAPPTGAQLLPAASQRSHWLT